MINSSEVTVITTHFNDLDALIQSIISINTQSCPPFCHIIVDAGTPDFSQTINSLRSKYSVPIITYIIPSISLYDGMNYAINQVQTKYYQILNSGSTYVDCLSFKHACDVAEKDSMNIFWTNPVFQFK